MTTPQPNSPLVLSRASLWTHIKKLFVAMCEMTVEHGKETIINGYCLIVYLLVWVLFPITFPLFAWIRRWKYQKQVKQWDRTVKDQQDEIRKGASE